MNIDIEALKRSAQAASGTTRKVIQPDTLLALIDLLEKAEAEVKKLKDKLENVHANFRRCEEDRDDALTWIERCADQVRRAEKAEARVAVLREALERTVTCDSASAIELALDLTRRTIATCDAEADKLRERLKAIDMLYDAIAHGDDNHRNWLRAKIDEHFGCAPSEGDGDAD